MASPVSHITRHQAPDGTVFQVHHFEGISPHDTHSVLGKVFIETPDGRALFSGGCPRRILELPELKEAEVAEESAPVEADAAAPKPKKGAKA